MTILASLARAYDRLADRQEVPAFGYSRIAIGFCIVISPDGRPSFSPIDLRVQAGKKLVGRRVSVPNPLAQRTSGIAPNYLWDKTAYAIGVTDGDGKRTARENAEFVAFNAKALAGAADPGLKAFVAFLQTWRPGMFDELGWPADLKDENVVFGLESGYREGFIHDAPEARAIWARIMAREPTSQTVCLVTGERGRTARSHSPIKGVWDAQSSGAYIVSYNATAFESYGNKEGDNAPVSEAVAFAYTTALNRFLERDSRNRIQIGDASTVFWADATEADAALEAEAIFGAMMGEGKVDEGSEAAKVGAILARIREGKPLALLAPHLQEGVRFHVLGLSPNAARLSVRFWLEGSFGQFAEALVRHAEALAIEPRPVGWGESGPSLQRMLITLFVPTRTKEPFKYLKKNFPGLSAEITRAILQGQPYPHTWLVATLIRLRATGDPESGWHAAAIKACLNRRLDQRIEVLRREGSDLSLIAQLQREKLPVALESDRDDVPYQLGRLFYLLGSAQREALGRVNATIADRYYGAASSTPARVFGTLLRGLRTHVSDANKRNRGWWIDEAVAKVVAKLPCELPLTLTLEEQGRFAIGFYHERGHRDAKATASEDINPDQETA